MPPHPLGDPLEESGVRLLDEGEHIGDHEFGRVVDVVSLRPGRQLLDANVLIDAHRDYYPLD